MLGEIVTVTVDRKLGTYHPKYKEMCYPVNYGFVAGVMAADGEEQDAYVLGVGEPVDMFTGRVIAVICRKDDVEDKWVVAPEGVDFTQEEIERQVYFQERYFDGVVCMEA